MQSHQCWFGFYFTKKNLSCKDSLDDLGFSTLNTAQFFSRVV